MNKKRALLIVVSAPSGAGKTTLCNRLLAEHESMTRSISCTTRAPRGTEVDGKDYHFLTPAEFNRRVADGLFLEHAVVHGNQYGTLRSNLEEALGAGQDVLMVIDVQGAAMVPGDRLLMETDTPYLAPVPHRGQPNEPAFLPAVARLLATVRGEAIADLARITSANAAALFGWPLSE